MRVRAVVAYDGSAFSGFAANPGVTTVAGTIEEALARTTGSEIKVTCAGRTDRGVHALGQVISFDVAGDTDLARLTRSVRALVGADITIRSLDRAPDDFDARFSARWRRYRYDVICDPAAADPFAVRVSWMLGEPLDLAAMRQGCVPLLGEHDFSSFCRRPKAGPDGVEVSLRRQVLHADWDEPSPGLARFEIVGTAFCHQMVRSIVGCLVAVGRGRLRAADVRAILTARRRDAAPPIAPPQGLTLIEVGYEAWDPRRLPLGAPLR